MVFQKPNPFPAMTIYENVLAGLKFTRTQASSNATRWSSSRCSAPASGTRSRTG